MKILQLNKLFWVAEYREAWYVVGLELITDMESPMRTLKERWSIKATLEPNSGISVGIRSFVGLGHNLEYQVVDYIINEVKAFDFRMKNPPRSGVTMIKLKKDVTRKIHPGDAILADEVEQSEKELF